MMMIMTVVTTMTVIAKEAKALLLSSLPLLMRIMMIVTTMTATAMGLFYCC